MTVLRVHAKRQDWPSSLNVFRDMQKRKVPLDSLVLNVILATGVAGDQIEGVEQLLVEADTFKPPISDVVSYNTLIKGYAQRNDALKAIQVINRMVQRGLTTNAITFNTAMDAAVRSLRIQEAWDLLKDMRKAGFRPDKFTCSILVKGLVKQPISDHIRNSLELLSEVDSTCDATLRSTLYHSVLESAAQVPDTVMLMNTFSQMRSHQVALTANAYRLLVQALGQEGDAQRCGQIWQQMLSEDIRPQASIFVNLLELHLRQGQVDGALSAFESLRTSIKSESKTRRVDGTSLLEECRVAFIRSLCRISREPEATHIYLQARSDGVLANIDSATGMMLARVQSESGNLSHAWMTIEDMIGLGHKPNEATLHAFLSACIKQSHTLYAKALLTKANTNNITLSQATFVLFLKLYGRCQQLQDALAVFDFMTEKQGIDPSPQTMVSLLRVCFQCRQPSKAFDIMEKLQAKVGAGPLDGSIYRVAFSGCANAGLIPKGVALVEDAIARGATLPPDSIEGIVAAVQRRGAAGSGELERLKDIADKHNLIFLPSEATSQVPLFGNI
jgi:pentatricopeptide repeat protein